MKRLIVKLIVVIALAVALLLPVASGHAHALVACNPLLHFPCTGGGVICVDKHGHVHRFHGHVPPSWHCVAI